MEYTMENFKNGKFVINCQSKDEANNLMDTLHRNNITWCTGSSLQGTDNHWNDYGSDTCFFYGDSGLEYGRVKYYDNEGVQSISFDIFITNIEAISNKEKVLKMIGVKLGEQFNIIGDPYNPYAFDDNYDLIDEEGDESNQKVFNILWGKEKIEKLPEDPNANIKKYIELLSSTITLQKDVREGILVSLNEILELKEQKSA